MPKIASLINKFFLFFSLISLTIPGFALVIALSSFAFLVTGLKISIFTKGKSTTQIIVTIRKIIPPSSAEMSVNNIIPKKLPAQANTINAFQNITLKLVLYESFK
jgi:hypothetical protein